MRYETMCQCAQAALDIQDACNLGGVVHDFADVMHVIHRESVRLGEGTDWKNNHPVVRLFVDKLASLSGVQGLTPNVMDRFAVAYAVVQDMAAGKEQCVTYDER